MTLYIIGNGFDLHHGLQTSYRDYRNYLIKNKPNIAKDFECSKYLSEPKDNMDSKWSELEEVLKIDYTKAFSDIFDFYFQRPKDEKIPGWNDMSVDVFDQFSFIDEFTKYYFYRWLSNVNMGVERTKKSSEVAVDETAGFISFNYTETLEKVYSVPEKNILYIHGTVKDQDSIQFGNPQNNPNEIGNHLRQEYSCDNSYNNMLNPAIEAMAKCANNAYKRLTHNMEQMINFITEYGQIHRVIVLGHSVMGIDSPYYERAVVPLCGSAAWIIYTHSLEDIENAKAFIERYDIECANIESW